MKKFFIFFAVALCMGAVTSCGDDDDDDNGAGQGNGTAISGPVTVPTTGGKQLLSIEYYGENFFEFAYSNGNLSSFTIDGDWTYNFQDNAYICQRGERTDKYYDIKKNKDGFITYFKNTYVNGDEIDNVTFDFTYSGKNVTKYVVNYSGVDDGEQYSEKATYTLTWENGNLVKVVCLDEEVDDTDTWIYIINYGNQRNVFKQYTLSIASWCLDDEIGFPMIGLFGEGPAMLPNQIIEYEEGDEDRDVTNFAYTLNSDGSIATEIRKSEYNDRVYTYHYSGEGTKSVVRSAAPSVELPMAPRHFKHGRRK